MSKDEIDKAVKEAEQYASEDKKRREAVETKNAGESVVFQLEKSLNELGDKVSADEKKPVEDAIAELKEALKGEDVEAIKAKTEAAEKAFYPIASKIYEQAAAANQAQNAGAAGADPNVVDADFTEVNDNEQ